jgi:ABC-type branched-subunit amino acid transport system ATPase component
VTPQIVDEIERIIRELAADNMTILLVEQNAAMALGIANRLMFLREPDFSSRRRCAAEGNCRNSTLLPRHISTLRFD